MGAGLKIGMRYGIRHWKDPLRLIFFTMPLYISALTAICYYFLGMDGASSLLVASVCAPTDPVLASELQLQKEEMYENKNTGIRYALTSEAGLNDGMAFPFVFLAIMWSKVGAWSEVDVYHWINYYVLYKILGGIVIGSILGYSFSLLITNTPSKYKDEILSGFMGIGLAILAFSIAELLHAYGFISAFFAGLFAQYHYHLKRSKEAKKKDGQSNEDKQELLLFNEKIEEFLIVLWTIIFGGFVASGILNYTDWKGVLVALTAILFLRPLAGRIGLLGSTIEANKKWAVSFFGIKGVGSFFYLAFALYESSFSSANEIYAVVSCVVILSILIHGLTGPRMVDYFKRTNPG